MKKTIYLLMLVLATGLCFSCSDDDDKAKNPVLSFASKTNVLPAAGMVEVVLNSSAIVPENTTVRFSISGTAVEGEDYELSAREFVIRAGERSAKIQITAKDNYAENRTIQLELLPVAGFDPGTESTVSVIVESKEKVIYSFAQENYGLVSSVKVELELKGMNSGSLYSVAKEMKIPFTISAASTAVKGVHYNIKGGVAEFVFEPGTKKASIQIDFVREEADKDQVVLSVDNLGAGFVRGNYKEARIQIYGPTTLGKLIGKWCFKEARSFTWLKEYIPQNGFPTTEVDNLPKNNSDRDTLEFIAGDPGSLKTHLNGDLKNYFRNCEITYLRDEEVRLLEEGGIKPSKVTISVMQMSKANVAFSASTTNEKAAVIGFRILDNGVLEISLYDFEPVDFLAQVYQDALSWAGDDVPMSYYPLRYHFTRVAE